MRARAATTTRSSASSPSLQRIVTVFPNARASQPLFDQELPLEGTTVRRRFLLRGFDGEVLTWTGRERLIGGRYGSVLLAFDQVAAE